MTQLATRAWQYVRKAAADWLEDKAPQMGAALAFYSVLSLAPLILISLAVAGLYNRDAAKEVRAFMRIAGIFPVLLGLIGGTLGSQLPEFSQQYRQRLYWRHHDQRRDALRPHH